MIELYLFDGKSYSTESEVRSEIWAQKRMILSEAPLENRAEFWSKHGVVYEIKEEEVNQEQQQARAMFDAKKRRRADVASIVVEVDGMTFDGSEISQERMLRCIHVMDDESTVQWVLSDNSIATVSKKQLEKALKLSVEKQCELWTVPYKE